MPNETKPLELLAEQSYTCAGNGQGPTTLERHPRCYGIDKGDLYVERNPQHDKYGPRHCLKCNKMFFPESK